MRRLSVATIMLVAGIIPGAIVFAQTQSSSNYQNFDSSVIPLTISAQSPNYSIDGSIEPIVGDSQSSGYTVQGGAQGNPGVPPTPTPVPTPTPSGGGGGGGGGVEPWPTATTTPGGATGTLSYVWVYRSVWEKITPLHLGDNLVGTVMVHRRLIGDVNDNRVVDDIDLSLFTRHWKSFDRQSDFNEDGLIDDIDLSLFASHWNQRY
ncbi:MAG: dockerin type I domain-containing protein [Candidatus Uhrbacteria bacterium]